MEQIRAVKKQMISISDTELYKFLAQTTTKVCKKQEVLIRPNVIPNEIYFINKEIIRVLITDNDGTEHTIHFALENKFIADYSNFMQLQPSFYTLQSNTENVSIGDVAKSLSEIAGKEIPYISPTTEVYVETLTNANVPVEFVGMFAGFSEAIKQGEFEIEKTDLETLLGRKPTTAKQYLAMVYGS